MVSLSAPRAAWIVPAPTLCQLVSHRVNVECSHLVDSVGSATEENAWAASVKIRRSEEVLCRAVAVAVAPYCVQVILSALETWQRVRHVNVCLGCLTVEVEQEFVACVSICHVGVALQSVTAVVRHVADVFGCAVSSVDNHVVSTAQENFSLAVHVPVVADDVVLLVRTGNHVRTEVDVPKTLALDVVALKTVETVLVVCVVKDCVAVALYDELRYAVAVNVGKRHVVEGVVGSNILSVTVDDRLHRNVDVLLAPNLYGCALFLFHAVNYGSNSVCAAC